MLQVELSHLCGRKISHSEGFSVDIKTAASGDDLFFAAGMDPVIMDVTHAAEDNALGKGFWSVGIAAPELPEDRDEGVTDQGVDFVDK